VCGIISYGLLIYKKTEAISIKSHNHSLPVLVGIPSNTGSLYNRGFDFEMHYDLIKTRVVTLNFVGNYNRALLISQILLENLSGTGRNGGVLGVN
jgi:hypothetical protein